MALRGNIQPRTNGLEHAQICLMSDEKFVGATRSPFATTKVINQIDGLPHGEQLHAVAILGEMATGWNGDLTVPGRVGVEARGHNPRPRSNRGEKKGTGPPFTDNH